MDIKEVQRRPGIPLVSVIIPCYNHAHFLSAAIESALDQTYKHIEVVVVDDGSTDYTPDIAAHYPEVRYARQQNRGLAAARNTGIRESQGSYLVFLDADDRLLPAALEAGVNGCRTHPACAFVFGDHRRVAPEGSLLEKSEMPRVHEDYFSALLRGNCVAMHATVMYRRSALEAVGGFDSSLPACEDYDLYLRIAREFPIYGYDEVIAEYRIHGTNMSRDAALMLRTSLAVLRAQWPHVRANRKYREAYKAGVQAWRAYYGPKLIQQVGDHMRSGDARRAGQGIEALLQCTPPGWLIRHAAKNIGQTSFHTLTSMFSSFIRQLQSWWRGRIGPPVGRINLGDLRRLTPISRVFGFDRGRPVDRYYIEEFLARHAFEIQGRVLEVGDNAYTRRFGGDKVIKSDVLHVSGDNPEATIVADLAEADHIPSDAFDCVLLTQTLHLIYDVQTALATLHRILKPGGVLLLTVPGISQIEEGEWGRTWYWSFTTQSIQRLLEETFPASNLDVETHGNVLAATAFLQGMAEEELGQEELDYCDQLYQLLITARAQKPKVA